ncbi:MAG: hypothetical protein ED557_11975 [Balneola sp.]|nr:MAG: hypothetical protein ED557_11975 [Balneola sp.]
MRVILRTVLFVLLGIVPLAVVGQEGPERTDSALVAERTQYLEYLSGIIDSNRVQIDLQNLPEVVFQNVESINLGGIDARNFFRGLNREYEGFNVIVDNRLSRQITVSLSNIPLLELLVVICQEYDLSLSQTGQLFRIREYTAPEPVEVTVEPIIAFENELLTLDLADVELATFTRQLTEATGRNIIIRNGVRGEISGYLNQVEFENGLNLLLSNNGFSLREKDGVYIIDRFGFSSEQEGGTSNFWVTMEDGLVNLDVVNAPITDIVREIGYQSDVNMVTYGLPTTTITAKASNLTIDQALTYIFRGTEYTYRKEGDMYVLGDKSTTGIASNKLIRLKHIRADVIEPLIPETIKANASVQVIKEQNGLMVIGTNDIIVELESFIGQVDFPTPQIMIEALVVDVNTTDLYQLGVSLSQGAAPDSSYFNPFSAVFGQGSDQMGGFSAQGSGTDLNNAFAGSGSLFGIQNLGRLPSNFFFKINALDQQGLVTVRSRPQISTINGYTASIEIGTTQYYLLTSTTPLQSPNQIVTQESQRFETIEANVLLEITPWVSASGDVTVEVHPEFNTPVGTISSEVPPTINSRVLDSTVRLKDGETIILGGLIQESETENINKVPILGNIPLVGRLFRNKSTNLIKSELVIFITPHVFYGDGTDNVRWNQLREDLNIDN